MVQLQAHDDCAFSSFFDCILADNGAFSSLNRDDLVPTSCTMFKGCACGVRPHLPLLHPAVLGLFTRTGESWPHGLIACARVHVCVCVRAHARLFALSEDPSSSTSQFEPAGRHDQSGRIGMDPCGPLQSKQAEAFRVRHLSAGCLDDRNCPWHCPDRHGGLS